MLGFVPQPNLPGWPALELAPNLAVKERLGVTPKNRAGLRVGSSEAPGWTKPLRGGKKTKNSV